MKILLTGFTTFPGVRVNPTELIIQKIAEQAHPDIIAEVLPVEFQKAGERIVELLHAVQPDVVICTGVAQNRNAITPERFAVNVNESSMGDNAGDKPDGRPIAMDGAAAYVSSLPVLSIRDTLLKHGIPAQISNHAGAYVCNHVFYTVMHELSHWERPIQAGFIHFPGLDSQAPQTGLPLQKLMRGMELILQVCMDGE